jgi:ADP-glucose pyrophosphorylase
MNILINDFVVISGDIITNIDLQGALKHHYKIKQEEAKKDNMSMEVRKYKTIMTKLFLKMSWANPLRDPSLDVTLLFDS